VSKPGCHFARDHLSRFVERKLIEPLINPAFDLSLTFGRHAFPFGAGC
jgi:hypothetical protein